MNLCFPSLFSYYKKLSQAQSNKCNLLHFVDFFNFVDFVSDSIIFRTGPNYSAEKLLSIPQHKKTLMCHTRRGLSSSVY